MKRLVVLASLLCFAGILSAQNVNVDLSVEKGPIKPLNGVNGGVQAIYAANTTGLIKNARIPYFRSHDVGDNTWHGAGHVVDISHVFPNFDADVNDPKSYDFYYTDIYVKDIINAGSQVYYRLGQTIEDPNNTYYVHPPKDFKKWAQICEHIIKHYNEGWADGFNYGIEYWQIWNEHDHSKPSCWTGTPEQFYDFYETVYKYLKKKFPHLQIGGPALLGNPTTGKAFIEAMAKRRVPLDFLSWHMYFHTVDAFKYNVNFFRKTLDENGYKDTPSFIDEWNIKPFDLSQTMYNAVLNAATMCVGQYEPVDMMLYYDVLIASPHNNIFTLEATPKPGYWTFYSWGQMSALGTSVEAKADMSEIQVAAATNADRTESGILLTRLNIETGIPQLKDPNIRIPRTINPKMDVKVNVKGAKASDVKVYMVDGTYTYQPYPAEVEQTAEGCTITISMARMSFAYIVLR